MKSGGRIFFIRADEIDWVDAAGNYVRLHVKGDAYLFRETMSAMEARLDPSRFVRIHRSHIVNADRIKELQPGCRRSRCHPAQGASSCRSAAVTRTACRNGMGRSDVISHGATERVRGQLSIARP